ncbi:5-bromo-4-chloroindolyl phosphate hydrolysis family protein [Shimia marina]|uniref:5-bromo-4-chloroindolyl phosphate hydrolysis protein n=1 Tax=Shimia marina TaxID=321267 RepID=A0A0P1F9X4_9RHOB|nr:5-bromo-4-chloroindolyl phosphate hydrolysis family protein [Shimia marina]CUH52519.1 5-bromo-4-chloroindolyl phosphate hydrolysis protein [Shimia marina]SFE48848.1 5-bromo-4-chloroindolyl phosphate hydrolysis protein [Shimia marina]
MAQRYSGKFSPNAASTADKQHDGFKSAKRSRAGGRVNLLFLAPLPLIWKAFTSPPLEMMQFLIALGALILAAWMTREGLIAQEAFEARKVARRPALPRKILGSALTATGLAIAGIAGHGPLEALVFAVLGGALHSFAFGLDPLKNKGVEGHDQYQSDRVARAVEDAESHLQAMNRAIERAGDRALERRVSSFQATARELFRTVEEDPRDLSAARRYLGVYLLGAKDATVKFADLYSRTDDAQARADYEALLDDLEQNFAARTQKLMLDDRGDLTIEIDVLRERLAQEGLRSNV